MFLELKGWNVKLAMNGDIWVFPTPTPLAEHPLVPAVSSLMSVRKTTPRGQAVPVVCGSISEKLFLLALCDRWSCREAVKLSHHC